MHVVVTGASSGIGEALAREYLKRGAQVTLVARRLELLERLAEGAPGRTHLVKADLADVAHCTDWLPAAEEALGPVDVLVNNAGIQIVRPLVETPWDEGERLVALDLLSPMKLTQAVARTMVARGTGAVVDVASMAGIAPTPGMYFYNAAKAGLAAASEALRAELAHHGVHVVTVYPGPVRTPLEAAGRAAYEASSLLDALPTGDAAELARLVARAVELKRPRVIYPASYAFARHFPGPTRAFMDALTPKVKGD